MDKPEESDRPEEIAVVGMAGRFPRARNVSEFWRNLRDGVESVSFFSEEELTRSGISPAMFSAPNYVRARGVLEDAEMFDAPFFGFIPKEAEITDPQQRLFLETAWEALESAGYDPLSYDGAVGVYAGASFSNHMFRFFSSPEAMKSVGPYRVVLANDKDHLATMTSYKLNLRGPSVTVQTACSTSLVATHMACQSLLNGECDMALAGGVSATTPQKAGYFHEEGGILSPDGHCRTFDARAAGTFSGSGVGVVVLKRLSDALADGDFIHAVVKASAINNDGALKVGYTAPSIDGQAEVITEAIEMAGVGAETITYVEAHGTATPMGDPIEVAALTKVFGAHTDAKGFCALGSVKSNVGHLDAAAGVTGLIKTVLALRHREIPPSLHFEQPNPQINFDDSPFYVNSKLSEWKSKDGEPRRAGVSSFGIGGTNAHVILEENTARPKSGKSRPYQLLTLSAKTETALDAATRNFAEHLRGGAAGESLADVAYTLHVSRSGFAHRRMLVCGGDAEDAARSLEARDAARVLTSHHGGAYTPVVFMFPGQGSQRVGMGRELYEGEKSFREYVDGCCDALRPQLGLDLRKIIYPAEGSEDAARELLNQTRLTQPALFVVEYALAKLWEEWGVRPEAMVGHSIGEYVAACLAGVMSLEDALRLVAARGRLIQALPRGGMMAVGLSEKEVGELLGDGLSLAAVNAPGLCVVSGAEGPLASLEALLVEREIFCRRLHTSHAFHSEMMEPALAPFAAELKRVKLSAPKTRYVSNVTGTWIRDDEATSADYWVEHIRRAVRFSDGLAEVLKSGRTVLLEVGPGRALQKLAGQQAQSAEVISSIGVEEDADSEAEHILGALGRVWLAGVEVNWKGFHSRERRRRVPLPTYPFERQRYLFEAQPPASAAQDASARAKKNGAPKDGAAAREMVNAETTPTRAEQVPAPNAVAHSSAVSPDVAEVTERIMKQQLELMSKQLELLRGDGEPEFDTYLREV